MGDLSTVAVFDEVLKKGGTREEDKPLNILLLGFVLAAQKVKRAVQEA